MLLVGFIIRIYHDARSPERQIHTLMVLYLQHLNAYMVKDKAIEIP